MRNFFLILISALAINPLFSQSTRSLVTDHVFLTTDEDENPTIVNGVAIYIVFHDNGNVQMLMGSDLSKAIRIGPRKSGNWTVTGSTVRWTWSGGSESSEFYYNSSSTNLISQTGSVILKNLGSFK
jgi:hypothetical protein